MWAPLTQVTIAFSYPDMMLENVYITYTERYVFGLIFELNPNSSLPTAVVYLFFSILSSTGAGVFVSTTLTAIPTWAA